MVCEAVVVVGTGVVVVLGSGVVEDVVGDKMTQAPSVSLSYPALQVHALAAVLPDGEYEFAGHAAHAWLPRPDLYVLAGQVAQASEYHPPAPASHTHSVLRKLPAGLVLNAGHGVQPRFTPPLPCELSA
jgi:hypothetical protein